MAQLEDQTFVGISEGMQKLIFGFEEIYEDVKDAIVQQFKENDQELQSLSLKKSNSKLQQQVVNKKIQTCEEIKASLQESLRRVIAAVNKVNTKVEKVIQQASLDISNIFNSSPEVSVLTDCQNITDTKDTKTKTFQQENAFDEIGIT